MARQADKTPAEVTVRLSHRDQIILNVLADHYGNDGKKTVVKIPSDNVYLSEGIAFGSYCPAS